MMGDKITGRCNCGQQEYVIPKPTDMNICRVFLHSCRQNAMFHLLSNYYGQTA